MHNKDEMKRLPYLSFYHTKTFLAHPSTLHIIYCVVNVYIFLTNENPLKCLHFWTQQLGFESNLRGKRHMGSCLSGVSSQFV
jgi:hypothetical protein